MKPFLGNFYRHLAIFFWSHCLGSTMRDKNGHFISAENIVNKKEWDDGMGKDDDGASLQNMKHI